MMGHREKLKSGNEWDFLTRAKRFYRKRAGFRAWVKRTFNKRVRRDARLNATRDAETWT
jgi:hypothetical protein